MSGTRLVRYIVVLIHRTFPITVGVNQIRRRPVQSVAVCPLRTVAVARAAAGPVSARSRDELRSYDDLMETFIAIIINSLDDAKRERDRDRPAEIEGPVSREQMVREIRAARDTLERLERRLEAEENDGRGK